MNLQFKIILKKYYKILLSITIIISLGVALLFGLKNGVLSVHKSIDHFIENNNYPDIKIITDIEDIEVLNRFSKNDYKSIDSRLSISTILKKKKNTISVKASTYDDKDLKGFYIWNEKTNQTDKYDILVEKGFANNNDIKLGDAIYLKIGDKYTDFTVTKIISVPEAMVTTPVNGLWGNINDYGNIYIHKNILGEETKKEKEELLRIVDEKEQQFNSIRTVNDYNNFKNELLNDKEESSLLGDDYLDLINNLDGINTTNNNQLQSEVQNVREEFHKMRQKINDIEGYESKFNEINIQVNENVDKEELLNSIKNNELKDIQIIDSYTYENSPVNNSINYNIVGMENVSTILPTIFYIIILIVLFLFITLIIKQSKTEIATFRLLGKTKNEIRLGYCLTNLIVSIFGIVLGLILGYFLMKYIVHYYQDFYLLPEVVYTIKPSSIIISILATIIVVLIATILATLELDKITPIEVLNKEKYQTQELSGFTKKITSVFKPLRKFSLIVYVRNKRNLILGIICTSATFALIFTSLAYVASKDRIFSDYFDKRIHYDIQLFRKGSISDEYLNDIRGLDYVKSCDILKYYNVTVENNNKTMNIVLNSLDNKNNYISIYDKNNHEIKYPQEGIVLEKHIADELDLEKNDYININNEKFKITDISFQSLGRVNYISMDEANKLDSSFETLVIKMDKNKQNDFINKVSQDDDYIYTVRYDNMRAYNKIEFDSYTIPATIVIVFAMIIGFIIILNINNYYLLDQKRNLSIFRSLGFHYSEISSNWFIQSIIQWILSIIIGLPTGILLSIYALKRISSARREYIYASGIKEILITIILLFVYIFISHMVSMRKLKQFDIIAEIKDRD